MLRFFWCNVWMFVVGIGVAACGGQQQTESQQATIRLDGSSTVFPISEAVA